MRATMLLSDHAQVANGKLYVLGGGWTHSLHVDTPMPLAVAVQLDIPWTAANEKHSLSLELTDDDGNGVEIDGAPVRVEGEFEAGRPPGIKPGSDLRELIVFKFDGIHLPQGGYVFVLAVNSEPIERQAFRVGT